MKLHALLLSSVVAASAAFAAADFQSLDKDGDGNISQSEAKTEKTLSSKFSQYDVDKDKVLSKQEFQVYEQQQQAQAGKVKDFQALDKDSDGNISQSEAKAEKTLSSKFSQYDVDKDKVLSKQEYQAFEQQEQLRRGTGAAGGTQQQQQQQGGSSQ